MRASIRIPVGGLVLAALLAGSGCSWFRHRHDAHAAEPAQGDAATALAVAKPLAPDAEQMRAATTLVTDFYEMRARLGHSGLPDDGDMKAYRAFLCPPLVAAMDSARVRQRLYIDEHPDDKPPMIEGDFFSSLVEGPDSVVAAGTEVAGEGARVSVSMRSGDGDSATRWKDSVLLSRSDGIWCIADVEYHGNWPFANKGKLSETLAAPF